MQSAAATSEPFIRLAYAGDHVADEVAPSRTTQDWLGRDAFTQTLQVKAGAPHINHSDEDTGAMNDRITRLETNAAVMNEKFSTISAQITASNDKMDAHMKVIESKFETIMRSHKATEDTLGRMDHRLVELGKTTNTLSGTIKVMPGWTGLIAVAAGLFTLLGVLIGLK